MKATEAFPSKFISAADLQGRDVTVKITHVAADEIGGKQKFVCFFAGKQKGLVLNKTNWNSIVRITGLDDSNDWTGAEICLYEAMVDFQGDSVPAVRIKPPPKREGVGRPTPAQVAQSHQAPLRDELDDGVPGF